MGTILCQAIIDQAEKILQDTANAQWPEADLFIYLKDAQRQIALLKPSAFVVNEEITLVAGTKQALPAGATSLNDVIMNTGVGGSVPGPAIRLGDVKLFNSYNPGWHSDTASAVVEHYFYDPDDPLVFYVYPPQPVAPGDIEIEYAATPTDPVAIGNVITLSDIYETILLDLILSKAFSLETTPQSISKSRSYFNKAVGALGRKDLVDKSYPPRSK